MKVIAAILKFAKIVEQYLKIFKAFVVGYEAFMSELGRGVTDENE